MGKPGQPTLFTEAHVEKAYDMALLGLTNAEMAKLFGVVLSTFENWMNAHPEFMGALRRGREEADAQVVKSLYRRATGYEQPAVKIFMPAGAEEPVYADYAEHYPADVAAATLWLVNRQRGKWQSARNAVEVSGPDGAPLVTQPLKIEFIDPQPPKPSEPPKK